MKQHENRQRLAGGRPDGGCFKGKESNRHVASAKGETKKTADEAGQRVSPSEKQEWER